MLFNDGLQPVQIISRQGFPSSPHKFPQSPGQWDGVNFEPCHPMDQPKVVFTYRFNKCGKCSEISFERPLPQKTTCLKRPGNPGRRYIFQCNLNLSPRTTYLETTFAWRMGWSFKTGFTVYAKGLAISIPCPVLQQVVFRPI